MRILPFHGPQENLDAFKRSSFYEAFKCDNKVVKHDVRIVDEIEERFSYVTLPVLGLTAFRKGLCKCCLHFNQQLDCSDQVNNLIIIMNIISHVFLEKNSVPIPFGCSKTKPATC